MNNCWVLYSDIESDYEIRWVGLPSNQSLLWRSSLTKSKHGGGDGVPDVDMSVYNNIECKWVKELYIYFRSTTLLLFNLLNNLLKCN